MVEEEGYLWMELGDGLGGGGLGVGMLGEMSGEKVGMVEDGEEMFMEGLGEWKVKDEKGKESWV